MTEKMPSSTRLGSRPISSLTFAYSASERPCSRTISGVMSVTGSRKRFNETLEQGDAVRAAQQRIADALGMRHQAQHVALLAEDSRDVAGRAVGIVAGGVAESDAAFAFEAVQRLFVGDVIAFAMRNREDHAFALAVVPREDGLRLVHFERHRAADEAEIGVADERAREETRFRQH